MIPNILFVNLPSLPLQNIKDIFSSKNTIYQPIAMPLGIMYISSYLKKNHEVNIDILDYALHTKYMKDYKNIDEFIDRLTTDKVLFNPDIIAISLLFSCSHDFFNICVDKIHKLFPNSIIVVGGIHATHCYKYLLENSPIDYVFRGESELSFSEFIQNYITKRSLHTKGVYSKENINDATELCDNVTNLDDLPFPDWNLINMEIYTTEKGRRKDLGNDITAKLCSLITTRGCPFKCTFCSSHTIHGRTVRYRSVQNIINEIKQVYKDYGVTLFIPEDDLFTANRMRCLSLLSEIKKLDIPNLEFQYPSALSINLLDKELIDALVDAKMHVVHLAIESGSEYVQKNIIHKNVNLNKAKELVSYLKSKGVIVRCYFIFGFPGETKKQMDETIKYIRELKADWCSLLIAMPLIGSEMYQQFVDMGYIKDDIETWSRTTFVGRTFDTPEISAKELNKLVYDANIYCNFIYNHNKLSGDYEKAILLYNDIVDAYPFHVIGLYCMMECYNKLGNDEKANEIKMRIVELIKTDKRASDMYNKYKQLIFFQ